MATAYSRRRFLQRCLSVSVAATGSTFLPAGCSTSAEGRRSDQRPNVLFILADDLGWGDLSCFGRPEYKTPALDALAAQGVRLVNAYANSCVCSPTRASFMTGRYYQRLGPGLQFQVPFRIPQAAARLQTAGLPPEHPTIATLLRAQGYHSALVGKWHLGYLPNFSPLKSGFNEFFGITSGGVDYFTHRDGSGQKDLVENDVPVERAGYITDLLSERAVQVIARTVARRMPFYLSLHYNAPHWPWHGPGDASRAGLLTEPCCIGTGVMNDLRDYAGGSLGIYAEMVKTMDAGIGRVLEQLDRLGVANNTLVVFTSDNGGERFSYLWPFSGGKDSLHEGGIRVPAIVRWPARLPAGLVNRQVAITMDWTATLLSAAGVESDPRYPLDGENLLPQLTGSQAPRARTLFWRHRPSRSKIVQSAVLHGQLKYLRIGERVSLFDLDRDEREQADLAAARSADVARLRQLYEAWHADMMPLAGA